MLFDQDNRKRMKILPIRDLPQKTLLLPSNTYTLDNNNIYTFYEFIQFDID